MGYGHSLDLRKRVIAAVEAGSSARAAARRFGVSASSAILLVQQYRKTGSYAPGQIGGQKKRTLAPYAGWLHEVMASEPDVTLVELQVRLAAKGVTISCQSISTMLRMLGYRFKKNRARRRAGTRGCRRSPGRMEGHAEGAGPRASGLS